MISANVRIKETRWLTAVDTRDGIVNHDFSLGNDIFDYLVWANNQIQTVYFPGLQNHCGHWLQPWNWKTLAPWKKSYNKPSILKSRGITLLTNVCIVKAMVFPVVMYGCENWTIKKAKHWRTDAFELWYWRRPLRVPWTARRSNQSFLKEINPEYSLEGLMLKLKL